MGSVNGDVSTNSAESYFALLKRGVHGTFHQIQSNTFHDTVMSLVLGGITEKRMTEQGQNLQ